MRLHRPERVSELIRHELSALVLREMEFPGALVTLTSVNVTSDLEHAAVKVSVLPINKAPEVMKKFKWAVGQLQFLLGRKLNIRPMPRIAFELDFGPERASAIEKDLLEIEKKEKML